MPRVKRLANGNLLVPIARKGKDGAVIDALQEVKPGSALYKEWLPLLNKKK